MEFKHFAQAVNQAFVQMSQHELFVLDVNVDELWAHYLASFPEGTNPVYITNTEHDCSCCRNFVKHLGAVVCVANGRVQTVWDIAAGVPDLSFYAVVADQMREFLKDKPIKTVFRTSEPQYGAELTKQHLEAGTRNWHHFWGKIAPRHFTKSPGEARGAIEAKTQVFARGLSELKADALESIAELIESNGLYRGEEHLAAVKGFYALHRVYQQAKTDLERTLIVLNNFDKPFAQFRNTAIGTLAIDLSADMDLEDAVKSFEAKVAPANYKRPKALITPRMVQDATKTIQALDLEGALPRRMATIRDITVNNVLWASRPASSLMKGGVLDNLLQETKSQAAASVVDKAQEISIADFMKDVLPSAVAIDLWAANKHQGNFVAMTTAEHADAPRLFKWPNTFGWSYDGNVADSIRDRVKAAGGKVDVPLRVSLSWFNYDDLDLHSTSPDGMVYFGARKGILDVDANMGGGSPGHGTRTPVENQAWTNPRTGRYSFAVNQYRRMELDNVGFTLELACGSDVRQFTYKNAVSGTIRALDFDYKDGRISNLKAHKDLSGTGISVKKWGVDTETFVPVRAVTYSPNHWDDHAVGNRHWFFLLEGCGPDLPVRGIYNEFLRSDLEQHRKVFEVLGDKTKCAPVPDQLAGLGFSSTREDSVVVRVNDGARSSLYTIKF